MTQGKFVPWNPATKGGPGWVEDARGCHIWTGARTQNGYPTGGDGHGRVAGIHRIRYEREVGPIPEGMELDHYVCDNGAGGCCNPLHCRPVTRRENLLRSNGIASAKMANAHCPQGHPLTNDNLVMGDLRNRGLRRCKTCAYARARDWRAKSRDKVLEQQREYLAKNKERINADRRIRARELTKEEREARRAYARDYYAKNPQVRERKAELKRQRRQGGPRE